MNAEEIIDQAVSEINTQKIAYSKALVAAVGELSNVAKTAANPYFKSKYAPLDAIIDATRPILKKHGLAVIQQPLFEEGTAGVETTILHEGGYCSTSTLLLPLKDQSPQGVGSAITYARRYALAAVLGIASEDDDDGNISTGLDKKSPVFDQKKARYRTDEDYEERPAVAKIMDKKDEAPRPAQAATGTWRGVEISNVKVAAQSKEGAAKKWTLYSVEFDGKNEALTFDEKLYTLAQELALGKVDAGVAPGKKDPSKFELVSLCQAK
jgi:ERF superfamily